MQKKTFVFKSFSLLLLFRNNKIHKLLLGIITIFYLYLRGKSTFLCVLKSETDIVEFIYLSK